MSRFFPDAQVTDFRESNPALTQGLERSTGLLSLICLVAMVLGAIGVAMAMRAHLQQRIDILAIMKSLGARSSDILRIYLFQTLLLGLAGGLLGVVAGLGVEWVFPLVLGKLLPMRPPLHIPVRSVFAGLGTGVLTTLLFCLPPLLDIRNIRPSLVLRRAVEEGGGRIEGSLMETDLEWQGTMGGRHDRSAGTRWDCGCALRFGKGRKVVRSSAWQRRCAFFWLLAKSRSAAALRACPVRASAYLRRCAMDCANLYRPGNQSAAVLAALGTGVMLILTVFLMQKSVIQEIRTHGFSFNTKCLSHRHQHAGTGWSADLLAKQPGVRGQLESLPVVSGRIVSVDGVSTDQLKLENFPKRMLQSVALTWSEKQPQGANVTSGKWWTNPTEPSIAVSERIAQRIHVKAGSQITLMSGEKTIHGASFRSLQKRRAARLWKKRVHPQSEFSEWTSGGVVRSHSCGRATGRRDATGALYRVSHGDRHQHC